MSIDCIEAKPLPAETGKKTSRTPYFVAMAVEIVLLYVVNNLLTNSISALAPYVTSTYPSFIVKAVNALASLRVPFMTTEFISTLWAVNLAITFAILGNLGLTLYHPRWFHHLMKGLFLAVSILPVFVMLKLFPFEFATSGPASVTRFILIVIMCGLALGFIVRIVLFIKHLVLKLKRDREKSRRVLEAVSTVASPVSMESLPKQPPDPPVS